MNAPRPTMLHPPAGRAGQGAMGLEMVSPRSYHLYP